MESTPACHELIAAYIWLESQARRTEAVTITPDTIAAWCGGGHADFDDVRRGLLASGHAVYGYAAGRRFVAQPRRAPPSF